MKETIKKFTIPEDIAAKFGISNVFEIKIEEDGRFIMPGMPQKQESKDTKAYTKTCNGCNEQIVLKEINDKWNAYDNYDSNDYHNCSKKRNGHLTV